MNRSDHTNQTIQPLPLRQIAINSAAEFERYKPGIQALLTIYQTVLLDDFCNPHPTHLVDNVGTYIPWLWILADPNGRIDAVAGLSDIIPGRHAYLHGVSHPDTRKHPAVRALGEWVLQVAFAALGVHKVKAEIEANNPGAKGFCRRMGFIREAHFRRDNRVNGQWQDVLVYSLFAEQWRSRRPTVHSSAKPVETSPD